MQLATEALDTVPREPSLAHLCAHTLDRWSAYLESRLPGVGDAQTWVTRVLVAFEGALVLARVQGSGEALRATGRWLADVLTLAEAPSPA